MNAELEDIEKAQRAEPPWDPLRERRVLARINAAREVRIHARRRRGRMVLLGAGLCAAAAVLWSLGPIDDATPPDKLVAQTEAPPRSSGGSEFGRLILVDGSEVELEPEARVEVRVQSEHEVRITQHAGEARYIVSHRPERAFMVEAAGVEVHVRGTRFIVRRSAEAIEVEVEEGRVEVVRDESSSMFSAGDAMRVRIGEPPTVPEEPPVAKVDAPPAAPRRSPRRPVASMDRLLTEADLARRAGRLDEAARVLRSAVSAHHDDPRTPTALFTLARVERRRGREAAAAEAFERAYDRDPNAVLAEDALAEAAVSWALAGHTERARDAAARYLDRFPSGEYVERVRALK